jgi:hypothetical protein
MFGKVSQFLLSVSDLAEAEGRVALDAVKGLSRKLIFWVLAALVLLLAITFFAVGILWLLAWIITWPLAFLVVGAVLLGTAYWLLTLASKRPSQDSAKAQNIEHTRRPDLDTSKEMPEPPDSKDSPASSSTVDDDSPLEKPASTSPVSDLNVDPDRPAPTPPPTGNSSPPRGKPPA